MSSLGRRVRIASVFAGLLVAGVVFGVAAVLESGVLTPRLIAWGNSRLEPATGLRLKTSAVYFRPWSGLTLLDVRLFVADQPDSASDVRYVLSVGEVAAGYRFLGVLGHRPRIQRVHVTRPDLDLDEMERWERITKGLPGFGERPGEGGDAGGGGLLIDDLKIVDGMIRRDRRPFLKGLSLRGELDGSGGGWTLAVDAGGVGVSTDRIEETAEWTGTVTYKDGTVTVPGLHLGVGGGRISFEGEIGAGPAGVRMVTSGYAIPLERIGGWFGIAHPVLSGDLEFRFLATGSADSLRIEGGLRGVAADGTEREFRVAALHHGNDIRLESLSIRAGESRVDLDGHVTLTDPPRIEGVAVVRNLDPALLLAEEDLRRVTGVEGTVRFQGTGVARETFDGSMQVAVRGGTFFGLPLKSASIDAVMRGGGVQLLDARLTRGGSSFSGFGSIDADNIVTAELTGTVGDLADLGPVAGDSVDGALEGQASARVLVSGPLAEPSVEAVLHFDDARVLGASARSLDLTLDAVALGREGEIAVDVVGRDVGYGDRVIPLAYATGAWSGGALRVTDLRLEGARRGEVRLRGALDFAAGGDLSGSVTRLDVSAPEDGARWTNSGPIAISRTDHSLTFEGLDLRSGSGRIAGDVSVAPGGDVFLRAEGVDVDLKVFSPFLLLPEPLFGTLNFDADAVVGSDTLAVDLGLDLRDGGYGGDRLSVVRGKFQVRDDGVKLQDVVLRSTTATADVRGDVGLRGGRFRALLADSTRRSAFTDELLFHDVRVAFETEDADRVKEVFAWFPSPGGAVSFEALLNGTADHPLARFRLGVANGRLRAAAVDRFSGSATLDGTHLEIESARLDAGTGHATASGFLPVRWSPFEPKPQLVSGDAVGVDFRVEALPAQALAMLTPLFLMGEGPVFGNGRLTGFVDSLWTEGEFRAEEGRLTIPEFQDPLVGGFVEGRLDREGVHLDAIRFSDGFGGRITGGGVVRLPNLKFAGIDVSLEGTDYHYRSVRGVQGMGDGRVRITERERSDGKLTAFFSGGFEVERAEIDDRIFRVAEEAAENVPEMPEGVQLPEEARRAPGADDVREAKPALPVVEIDLVGEKNVWVKTEEMEVELAGAVTFHVTEDYIGLSGDARTLRGHYAVLNTDFDVERAEMSFVDPSDMLASVLDAEATCHVLDEDVTFDVTGTFGDPVVVGHTESGMSESEIYELLALRRKRQEADGTAPVSGGVLSDAFYESWGALLATRFGRELSREIGLDTFDVAVEGENRTVGVGKYVAPDVFIHYREKIGPATDPTQQTLAVQSLETPDRQLLLEYRLSRILQLQGETGVIQDDPYLNIDLKAQWGY